ncbi:FAD-containing oxidoreductase [Caulobacter sp. 17J65-9]|uniref:FAD-containing oxidoreductase n=1 Tax=Caulobacter sp. 17J65-9 TaxID=2709382 RepID=UPI0013CC725D|nr:FAD-containing oxidoreductase [Caulobacter sp. 17J65-9]NEX92951.1 FAD-containing oxidoreductase [Caulobacter sp. 17J65-9]
MAEYDAIVIGAGQAGPSLALRLAATGWRTAIIERARVGGTCVNVGCTPTKTLIASARVAWQAREAARWGVSVGELAVDMKNVKRRMDEVVLAFRRGLEHSLSETENCTLIRGQARFTAPGTVSVGDQTLTARQIFLNVGARPAHPSIDGLEGVGFLTSSTVLSLDEVPAHLVIIGGSYVGLEFAQAHRRLGAQVTVIEADARLLSREDPEVCEAIRGALQAEGVRVVTDAMCVAVEPCAAGVRVRTGRSDDASVVEGSHLLVAAGRTPNTGDLGLDAAGVETDKRGYVTVDERLRTSAEGVWALGECNGRGAFTHTAYNDFEIVAGALLDGEDRKVGDRLPAYALYTDPPLGRVGMTETEARASGRNVKVGARPMTRVARALEKGETEGLMKIVVDADSQEILGAAILGPGGDEAIHAVLDAMYAKMPYPALRRAMHVHPTVAELIPTLLGELK